MIPESSENRTIELYECKEFPYNWEKKMTLMENIMAADSTLYFHNNIWWLFTYVFDEDCLRLFYSEKLMSDQWTEHPQSPIDQDISTARAHWGKTICTHTFNKSEHIAVIDVAENKWRSPKNIFIKIKERFS